MSGEHPFLERMEDLKSGYKNMGLWNSRDMHLMEIVYMIEAEVKQYFPMNEIPEDLLTSLKRLRDSFHRAECQLIETLDEIIIETQKFDGLE